MPEKLQINSELLRYNSIKELTPDDQKLLQIAVEASANAYAPYSSFLVGAAVLLENGAVVIGNNQENAAYPSGLCAERVAIFQASAQYPGVPVLSIAIAVNSLKKEINEPVAPCGACRQAMLEYELRAGKPIRLIFGNLSSAVLISSSVSNLLPYSFSQKNL